MKLNPIFKKKARPIYDASPNTRYDYETSSGAPTTANAENTEVMFTITLPDESFWNGIEHLGWQDRSDQVMIPANIRERLCSRFTPAEMQQFHKHLRDRMEDIREVLLDNNQSEELITDALLSHIVGKGMIFYTSVLDDPDFAMYLTVGEGEDVQDLWSIVCDII